MSICKIISNIDKATQTIDKATQAIDKISTAFDSKPKPPQKPLSIEEREKFVKARIKEKGLQARKRIMVGEGFYLIHPRRVLGGDCRFSRSCAVP